MRRIAFILILLTLTLVAGCGEETVDLDGELVNYDTLKELIVELESEVESTTNELSANEDNLESIQSEINDLEEEHQDLIEAIENEVEIKKSVKDHESELKSIEETIANAQEELEKLEGDIVKAQDEPVNVSAGYFNFGSDIEPGRYKMTAQEGSDGNVFVRRNGRSYVNIIIGNNRDVKDYVFEAESGDEIEATIPLYLYPVE